MVTTGNREVHTPQADAVYRRLQFELKTGRHLVAEGVYAAYSWTVRDSLLVRI